MTPSTRSISVKKNWIGKAAQEVSVNLLANGKKVKNAKLNEANRWSYDFTGMPVLENVTDKEVIQYTVEEEVIDGYTAEITGSMKEGFVITNKQTCPSIDDRDEDKNNDKNDEVNKNSESKQNSHSIKTGDSTNVYLFLMMSIISLFMIAIIAIAKKYSYTGK